MAMFFGIVLLLFGALVPPLLFPHENQILVGFVGAPFVLFGIILMLIGSFPTRRLDDERRDGKDDPPGPGTR
ncbi:MAG TPA: hypothetical protein VLC10_01925 [Patescibacteria group bacterium]|nr:hypothetical protein [Patescibacteria group bacterium]